MEKEINKEQEMLMELIESKSFESLTEEEKGFVLEHMSEEEFNLQRKILLETKAMDDDVVPLPLIIPNKKRGIVIPLYQAIGGIAAAVLLSFFLLRTETTIEIPGEQLIVAQTDTVYVDKVIVDTIIEYRTEFIERAVNENTAITENTNSTSQPMFGSSTSELPDLSTLDLSNRGTSAINDETYNLLEGVRF
ncbi:MAG: hypothetical protein QNK23_12640 [Crocinitomicaceae bacterium]|nr:hypothetical protein [Crocinitomicaceae bacterium]